MARVTDPVCGMVIDSDTAAARSTDAEGRTVYFCSVDCQRQFEAHPERYDERAIASDVSRDAGGAGDAGDGASGTDRTRNAPKFGSATSGGGEFEPLPGDRELH